MARTRKTYIDVNQLSFNFTAPAVEFKEETIIVDTDVKAMRMQLIKESAERAKAKKEVKMVASERENIKARSNKRNELVDDSLEREIEILMESGYSYKDAVKSVHAESYSDYTVDYHDPYCRNEYNDEFTGNIALVEI